MEKRKTRIRKMITGCCLLLVAISFITILSVILIPNKNQKGTIQIYCVDQIQKQLKSNILVSLYSAEGNIIDSKTSNDKGEITWNNIAYGKYYVALSEHQAVYATEYSKVDIKLDLEMVHFIMDLKVQKEG